MFGRNERTAGTRAVVSEEGMVEHDGNIMASHPDSAAQGKRVTWIHSHWMFLGFSVILAAGSLFIYWKTSHPRALGALELPPLMAEENSHHSAGSIDILADRLKQKLEQHPDNGEGWALLARSYVELGRHAEALPAFERAVKLIPGDAQLLADYADALGVVNGGILPRQSEQLIKQAIDIDPNNVKARLLTATVAFDRKQYGQAIAVWESMAREPSLAPELRQEIAANISDTRRLLGGVPQFLSAFKPQRERVNRTAIGGMVRVAPHVAERMSSTDTLFVFARPLHGALMPVAAVRKQGASFPYAFQLDDSHSIMLGTFLSESGEVVVVARLSRSGDATAAKGDFEGKSQPVRPGAEDIQITIDAEIQ